MQIAGFLQNHGIDIINAVLMLVGVLIGKGFIKDKTIEKIYEVAVAIAEQWKKNQAKKGVFVVGDAAKQVAIDYLSRNLPAGVPVDTEKLEGMVYKVTNSPGSIQVNKIIEKAEIKPGWGDSPTTCTEKPPRARGADGKYKPNE